jgi:hypothetical protein
MVAATERLLHEKAPRMPILEEPQTETNSPTESALEPAADAKAQENCLGTAKLNTAA